jgi:hypothetical protein
MKGIVFGGCSFTWGQGLYFYSDLNRLIYPDNEFTYNAKNVTYSHIKYKDTIRYARLVANHFKTFECFKTGNGGSEDETFDFLNCLFSESPIGSKTHLTDERLFYDDVEYIVIQTSQLWRNRFYYDIFNPKDWINIFPFSHDIEERYPHFAEWCLNNSHTIDEFETLMVRQQFERLKRELKFYEDKGIKTKILCWENDLLDLILKDNFMSDRFIRIEYKDKEYDTISELQKTHKHMKIKYDFENFGDNPPDDHHPSKECHEIIAKSIIKNIEKDLI